MLTENGLVYPLPRGDRNSRNRAYCRLGRVTPSVTSGMLASTVDSGVRISLRELALRQDHARAEATPMSRRPGLVFGSHLDHRIR